MTTSNRPSFSARPAAAQLRTATRISAAISPLVVALAAGPAFADVPVGWSDPAPVSPLDFLWIVIGAPLTLFLIIGFIAYVPALIKGEKLGGGQMPTAAPSARLAAAEKPAELNAAE